MEQTAELEPPQTRGGRHKCLVCRHPQIIEISKDLVTLTPTEVRRKYSLGSRDVVHRHLSRCLGTTSSGLREYNKNVSQQAIADQCQFLLDEATEAFFATKELLMVEGEVNMNPRAHEIKVIVNDYTDMDEKGEPRQKEMGLDEVIAMAANAGYHIKHTFLKQEDVRKTYREMFKTVDSLIDRICKVMGIYQQEQTPIQTELDAIRAVCTKAAKQMGTTYHVELQSFLAAHGHRLRPDLRGMLIKESHETPYPLPFGTVEVETPLRPSIQIPAIVSETTQKEPPKK